MSDNPRLESNPSNYVGVASARLIYIGIKSRADFDKIAVECRDHGENDHGHVLTKEIQQGDVSVIFQHWIKQQTIEALKEDLLAVKEGRL